MNKLLASSSDPKQLSLTIKGALVLLVPLVALIVKAAGGQVDNADLQGIVDVIADIVFFAGSIVSLGATLVGAVRKIVNSFK